MSPEAIRLWDAWRRRRDGAAFEALVAPDLGRALGLARRLGCSGADAEDAVQDALVRLAVERGDDPERVGVRAWLFRTVRDRAKVIRRGEGRRRGREARAARPEAQGDGAPPLHAREQVERVLAELAEDDREAVTLRYLQDLDYSDMAVVLRCTPGACRLRVHRALEKLRRRLGPGAASLVAALPLPFPGSLGAQGALAKMVGSASAAGAAAGGAATAGTVGAGTTAAAASAGAGTGMGAAATAAGGVLVATTLKVGTVAAVSAVLGAAGLWGAMAVLGPGTPEVVYEAGRGTARAPVAVPAGTDAKGDGGGDDSAAAPGADDGGSTSSPEGSPAVAARSGRFPLGDLQLTPEEQERAAEFIREDRRRREAQRIPETAGGLDVLKAVRAGADASTFLEDFDSVRKRFHVEGATVRIGAPAEGEKVDLAELAKDANIVEFGPGRFVLSNQSMNWTSRVKGVASLEIRGAGMDRTILVPPEGNNELVSVREGNGIENLHVHDLTIEGGPRGAGLINVQGEASALVENVRFRGWIAAGHAAPIGVTGAVFLAVRGCEFLGEGRRVHAVSVRGPVVAVMEDSLFSGLECAFTPSSYDEDTVGRIRVLDSRFIGSPLSDRDTGKGDRQYLRMTVERGSVAFGAPDLSEELRIKVWGGSYAESLKGISWGPAAPNLSLESVARAVVRMRTGSAEIVTLVQPEIGESGESGYYVATTDGSLRKSAFFLPREAGSPVPTRERGGGWSLRGIDSLEGVLSLEDAIRRSGVSLDTDVSQAGLGAQGSGDTQQLVWNVWGGAGWPRYTIDARSGELLQTSKPR